MIKKKGVEQVWVAVIGDLGVTDILTDSILMILTTGTEEEEIYTGLTDTEAFTETAI